MKGEEDGGRSRKGQPENLQNFFFEQKNKKSSRFFFLLSSVDLRVEAAGIVSRISLIRSALCHLRVCQHGILLSMVVELNLDGGNGSVLALSGIGTLE